VLYGKTPEKRYEKAQMQKNRSTMRLFEKEYCKRWILVQSAHINVTTLNDYKMILIEL